jgi:hypothetical protein
VGLVWALAIWLILAGIGRYAFENFDYFGGQPFTPLHQIGLFVIAILGVALWIYTGPDRQRTDPLHLHTTQLFSGALFIILGIMMLNGSLATFNNLIPTDLATWFADIEENFVNIFN